MMRALVLSGGGANGAFEAGIMYHAMMNGVQWDLIVGTSVGAANGAFVSQYTHEQAAEAATKLRDLWFALPGDNAIYRKHYSRWINWAFPAYLPYFLKLKRSVYSSKPWHGMIDTHIDRKKLRASGKRFIAAAVPWGGESEVVYWNERSRHIVDAVKASSAYPVMFSPVEIGGRIYTDGGLRAITPIKAAINAGATHIDVVQCSSGRLAGENDPRGLDQILRVVTVLLDEVDEDDYNQAELINRLVRSGSSEVDPRWRAVSMSRIRPERSLGSGLDFSPEKNRRLFDAGVEASKNHDW